MNVSCKSFFQYDVKARTSTELFQNNKICTSSCSKICNGDMHVLDLFLIFTPSLNIVLLKTSFNLQRGREDSGVMKLFVFTK